MALNTYPDVRSSFGISGGVALYLDEKLSMRALVYDLQGRPLPGNVIVVSQRTLPEFQSAAPILYARDSEGGTVTLHPSSQRTAVVVTGAKGGNAALTSLLSGLAQLGLVVDSSS